MDRINRSVKKGNMSMKPQTPKCMGNPTPLEKKKNRDISHNRIRYKIEPPTRSLAVHFPLSPCAVSPPSDDGNIVP